MNESKTNLAAVELPRAGGIVGAALGWPQLTLPELLARARAWARMLPANDPRGAVLREDIAQAQRDAAEPWACLALAQALVLLGAAGPVNHQHVKAAFMVADAWHWPPGRPGWPRAGTIALEALGLKSLNEASPAELLVLLADAYCDMPNVDDVFNTHLAIAAPAEFARLNAWRPAANDEGGAQ